MSYLLSEIGFLILIIKLELNLLKTRLNTNYVKQWFNRKIRFRCRLSLSR
jgi:hypothetical protein